MHVVSFLTFIALHRVGLEQTYDMQLLDLRTPGSERKIHLASHELLGVDRVYILLIGVHRNFLWLPIPRDVQVLNTTLSKHPNQKLSCDSGDDLTWEHCAFFVMGLHL